MSEKPSHLRRLGRVLEALHRLVASVLLLGILAALVALAVSAYRSRPRIPDGAALVLNPKGVLVEQLSSTPVSRISARLAGLPAGPRQVLLRDVLDALRLAKDDDRIGALYLDVDDLRGGMSKLRDVGKALLDFSVEPGIDATVNKLYRKVEHDQERQNGKTNEHSDNSCLEFRAGNACPVIAQ